MEPEIEILKNTIQGLKHARNNAVECDSVSNIQYKIICRLIDNLEDKLMKLEIEENSIRMEAI